MIAFCAQAEAVERMELSEIIASCTGRLSAEMEFAWLLSLPEADLVEHHRAAWHFDDWLAGLCEIPTSKTGRCRVAATA